MWRSTARLNTYTHSNQSLPPVASHRQRHHATRGTASCGCAAMLCTSACVLRVMPHGRLVYARGVRRRTGPHTVGLGESALPLQSPRPNRRPHPTPSTAQHAHAHVHVESLCLFAVSSLRPIAISTHQQLPASSYDLNTHLSCRVLSSRLRSGRALLLHGRQRAQPASRHPFCCAAASRRFSSEKKTPPLPMPPVQPSPT